MTLSIDSGQLTLSKRPDVMCLPLVVLQTFTDRDASTVASAYYWTRGTPLKYQWDGVTSVWFEPRLESVSPIVRGFPHIPNAGDFNTRETVRIVLDATERAGEFLWEVLTGENLIGARVTIASLLAAFDADDPRAFDLSALGDVHLVRWRGEVTLIPSMSDENQVFELVCETEETPLAWPRLVGANRAPPAEVGKILPVPIGTTVGAMALRFAESDQLTLDEDLAASGGDTLDIIGDKSKFRPTRSSFDSGGYAAIGDEIVLWTDGTSASPPATSDEIIIITRGQLGTTAVAHAAGEVIRGIFYELRYVISAYPVISISAARAFDSGGSVIDLPASAVFLSNHWGVSEDGPRSMIVIEQHTLATISSSGRISTGEGLRLEVDVDGIYERGATATELLDFDGSSGSWVADHGSLTQTGVTNGVELSASYSTDFNIARLPFASTNLTQKELVFTFNIDATNLARLAFVRFSIGQMSYTGGYGVSTWLERYADANVTYYRDDLVVGDNEIRLYTGNTKASGADLTASVDFTVAVANDGAAGSVVYQLLGPIDYYSVSAVGPHPMDTIEYVVENIFDQPGLTVDATSFATAKTNLPSVEWGGDLSAGPRVLAEMLARFGYECRTNLYLDDSGSSSVIKANNADAAYQFGAAVRTIDDYLDLRVAPKTITEIVNRFTFLYGGVSGIDFSSVEAYAKSLRVTENSNPWSADVPTADLNASQASFGVREGEVAAFGLIAADASLQEVVAYYVQEAIDGARMRYSLLAPWWLAYDLEPGDVVEVTPRWKTSAVKLRVVQVAFNFREPGVGLNLEEVL